MTSCQEAPNLPARSVIYFVVIVMGFCARKDSGNMPDRLVLYMKIIDAYLKCFSKYRRMVFSFLEYFFHFRDNYVNKEGDDVMEFATKSVEY